MDPTVAAALDALRAALARTGQQLLVVHLVYQDGATELLTLPASPPAVAGATASAAPLRQQILEVLNTAPRPLKAAEIAQQLHRSNSGHFRETLSGLVASGNVEEHEGHTYWPAGRELPSGWE